MVGPTSFQRGFGDPDVPLVLGTYRGIRQWSAEPDGQLHGEAGHMWQPGVNVAACNPRTPLDEQPYPDGHDEALPVDCTCGFYAYWRIRSYRPVVGVVEGSGMVVRGPRGFRAEKARLLGVAPGSNWPDIAADFGDQIRAAGRHYGVPVFADTAHLLIAFPVERPSDIPAPDPAVEIVLSPTAIQHALATMSGGLQAWQASMMRMAAAFEEAQRRAEQAMKPIADRLSKLGVSLSDPPKQTGRLHPSIGRPMFGPGSQSRRRF